MPNQATNNLPINQNYTANQPTQAAQPRKPRLNRKQFWTLAVVVVIVLGLVGAGIAFAVSKFTAANSTNFNSSSSQAATDTRPLEVEVVNPTRNVLNPTTEVTVITNKPVQLAEESNRITLKEVGRVGGDIYYVARVSNLAVDTTTATLKLKDEVGNNFDQVLTITRGSFTYPLGYKEIPNWPDAEYVVNIEGYKGPIDRKHRLLEDYQPKDLIDLNKELGIYTFNNAMLRADAARALDSMLRALRTETNQVVTVASGFRDYNTQMSSHAGILIRNGEQKGLQISARPGHSEHQLGTTFDLTNADVGYDLVQSFDNTVAGKWLIANSEKYGFIRSLGQEQTDYIYEPWHFRYVGKE